MVVKNVVPKAFKSWYKNSQPKFAFSSYNKPINASTNGFGKPATPAVFHLPNTVQRYMQGYKMVYPGL